MAGRRKEEYRQKVLAMVARLGSPEFEWIVDGENVECRLIKPVRIILRHCENATMVGKLYHIYRVTGTRLVGRKLSNMSMYEIDLNNVEFSVVKV